MIIPEKIQLAGKTFRIETNAEKCVKEDVIGKIYYDAQNILLQKESDAYPLETIEETLIHELLHASLFLLGESELAGSEKLVTGLSSILYQAIKQIEGNK